MLTECSWVKAFVEAQGQVALTSVLSKINRRKVSGPVPAPPTGDKDLDREYDIMKCLKSLMNNKYGADDALAHQQVIIALMSSLLSPRLNTRKLVSEVLTFLCHWAEGTGHKKVIEAMDHAKNLQNEAGRFDAWMRIVEVTIDGRGKMGSLVGASEEYRSGGIGMENMLMEYAVSTLILVNMLVDAPKDLSARIHIRTEFGKCSIGRLFSKMEGFQYEVIDKQIEHYRENRAIDDEDMFQRADGGSKDSVEDDARDMNDPAQITSAILSKVKGSRSYDFFLSAMQHMLLIRQNSGEDGQRMFQLIDHMVSYVAMDRTLPDVDLRQGLSFTVQNLLDKLYTDAEARKLTEESSDARQLAEAAIAERDEMRAQIELGAEGMVRKLQKQIDEQTGIIDLQQRQNENLRAELADLHRLRAKELQRNELETRELYLMLRDAQDIAASNAKKNNLAEVDPSQMNGILDREKLLGRLERQLERTKTQFKLEGKVWGQHGPSDRLRELREKMDGTGDDGDAEDDEDDTETFKERTRNTLDTTRLGSIVPRNRNYPRQIEEQDEEERAEELNGNNHESGRRLTSLSSMGENEDFVYEKPRLVEMHRPRMSPTQAAGLLGEITSKVPRFGSDGEESGESEHEAQDAGEELVEEEEKEEVKVEEIQEQVQEGKEVEGAKKGGNEVEGERNDVIEENSEKKHLPVESPNADKGEEKSASPKAVPPPPLVCEPVQCRNE